MGIPPGTYTVTASAAGYEPQIIVGVTVIDGVFANRDFNLNPAALRIESAYPTMGLFGQSLNVAITGTGFDVNTRVSMYLDAGNRKSIIGSVDTPGYAVSVKVVGDRAYVADGGYGLKVIDISNPANPQIIGSVDTPDNAYSVAVVGDMAYVADETSGLQVINISNPQNPVIIGSVDTPNYARDVTVVGDRAYVADSYSGLQVIDISDPQNPVIIGSVDTPDWARSVTVVSNWAYVVDGYSGLQVIDISDPANPQIIGSVDTPSYARGVTVVGNTAYVADDYSGVQVIDISNPANPQIIGSVDTPGFAYGIKVVGDRAYVADGGSGLQVIDITNPANPVIIGSVDTPGNAYSATVVGDIAYVADFDSGLIIVPVPVEISAVTVNSPTSISVTLPSPVIAGRYTLRVFNSSQNDELPSAVTFTENLSLLDAKAIIVAGGGPDASGEIWEETKLAANKAYDVLIQQGYDHDSIYYLSWEFGNDYVDGPSVGSFLEHAINTWAADASQLLIYFVDHGGPDSFILYGDGNYSQTLSASELDGWLDTLQQTLPGPVTFIYDACESGTFVSKLRPPLGKERIIITSASSEPANFLQQGLDSFSFQFWDNILQREGNLGHAFSNASEMMRGYQTALIDANGNGVTNEQDDMDIAGNVVVQRGSPVYLTVHPYVSSVCGVQTLSGNTSATISASGIIDAGSVWATIIPPDINPATAGIPITDLPTIQLTDPDHNGTYEAVYSGFVTAGTYIIVVKALATHEFYSYVSGAMVPQNIYSLPLYTSVTQTIGAQNIDPDSYEDDDTFSQANFIILNDGNPQPHNFHDAGDADWVKFFGIDGQTYKIKASNLSIVTDAVIALYGSDGTALIAGPKNDAGPGAEEYLDWTCQQDGVYYVKISNANSNFGENVKYDLKVYRPIADLFDGIIKGLIKDSSSGQPVPCNLITKIITSAGASGVCTSEGYLIFHPLGNFTVSIDAQGYAPKSKGLTVVAGPNQLNFELSAETNGVLGDLNGDTLVTMADAVIALQVMAGMQPPGLRGDYTTSNADVNGDSKIGIEEVLFILQKVAEIR